MAEISRTIKKKNALRFTGIFLLLSALLLASQVWFALSETITEALTWILVFLFVILDPKQESGEQPKTPLPRKVLRLLWLVVWWPILFVVEVALALIAAVGIWKITGLQPQIAGAFVLAIIGITFVGLSLVHTGHNPTE